MSQIVAAVCHGPAALIKATKPGSSESILAGIPVTGFANSEEAQTQYNDFVNTLPFSLEEKLNELSNGHYQQGASFTCFFVYGNGVLTGQNPASAGPYAQKLMELLAEAGK
jgi:putative intracellular protease/amidase